MQVIKTIKNNSEGVIIEKKSKFIANAFYVESIKEAEIIIQDIKKKYHDARHNTYAYRIMEEDKCIERQSDDRRTFRNSRRSYT